MWASSLVERLSVVSPVLLPVLLDAAIKGAAILALTALVTLAMRRSSAAARHLVSFLGTFSLLMVPMLSLTLPSWRILPRLAMDTPAPAQLAMLPPVVSDAGEIDRETGRQGDMETEHELSSPTPGQSDGMPHAAPVRPLNTVPTDRRPASSLTWQAWCILVWMAGTAVLLMHVVLGFLSLRWLEHRSSRITDGSWPILLRELCGQLGIHRQVTLLSSPRRSMPMTWGLWRTRLLLPEDSAHWPAEQRRALLMHELAHAKRCDRLTQLAAQIARACYWFNPLVWLAWRQMQTERERACDDLVLSTGTKASAYAEQLLHIASEMPPVRFSAAAIAMARPSKLEGRLLAILDVKRNRRMLTWGAAVLAIGLIGIVAVPLSTLKAADPAKVPAINAAAATQQNGDTSAQITPLAPNQNGASTSYRWHIASAKPFRLMSSVCSVHDGKLSRQTSGDTGDQVLSGPWDLQLKITPGEKELGYEIARINGLTTVAIQAGYVVPAATPNMQTRFEPTPRTAPAVVGSEAKLVLWSGRWVRSDQNVADELALMICIAPPDQSGYFLGDEKDPVPAVEPIPTLRRFPNVKFYINNRRYGDSNGMNGSLQVATNSAQCGHPGAVSDLSSKFLRSTRDGDEYEFTRKFPIDTKDPAEVKISRKVVTYTGKPLMVFADAIQRIAIFPRLGADGHEVTDAQAIHSAAANASGLPAATEPAASDPGLAMPRIGDILHFEINGGSNKGRWAYSPARQVTTAEMELPEGVQIQVTGVPLDKLTRDVRRAFERAIGLDPRAQVMLRLERPLANGETQAWPVSPEQVRQWVEHRFATEYKDQPFESHSSNATTTDPVVVSKVDAARLDNATQHFKVVEQQYRAGLATALDFERAKWDLKVLEAEQSSDAVRVAQARLEGANAVLKIVEAMYRAGLVGPLDHARAQWAVKVLEAEQSGDTVKAAQARLEEANVILKIVEAMTRQGMLNVSELQGAQANMKLRQAELDAAR